MGQQHGIDDAYYSSNGELYLPIMDCTCGFSTGRQPDWETVGSEMDQHLRSVAVEMPTERPGRK